MSSSSIYEGTPLLYYRHFNYLNRFEFGNSHTDEVRYDSNQSDSENSVSSLDVGRATSTECNDKPIATPNNNNNNNNSNADQLLRCDWKSCGALFASLPLLSRHVTDAHAASCGTGGLFYCGWQGCARNARGFNARYKMLVHVRTHTNEKPHRCRLCEKSFSRAENLKIHARSHSGEKPYACPVPGCNKAYSNSSDRFKHTRTHQVEKPYACKMSGCTKRYTDPSSLRKHVKTYKHFVVANGAAQPATGDLMLMATAAAKSPAAIEDAERGGCACSRSGRDLIKLRAYIDLSGRNWNDLILTDDDGYGIYNDGVEVDVMDLPLDLSVGRN